MSASLFSISTQQPALKTLFFHHSFDIAVHDSHVLIYDAIVDEESSNDKKQFFLNIEMLLNYFILVLEFPIKWQ